MVGCAGSAPIQMYIPMGHSEAVTGVDVTPDGRFAASGSSDGTIILWNMASGQEVKRLHAGEVGITSVGISPDANQVMSGHMDGSVQLWEWKTDRLSKTIASRQRGQQRFHFERGLKGGYTENPVDAIRFFPDGRKAVFGGKGGASRIDIPSGRFDRTFEPQHYYAPNTSISPNGQFVLSGFWGLEVWDVKNAKHVFAKNIGRIDNLRIFQSAIASNGKVAVSAFREQLVLWDLETGLIADRIRSLQNHIRYLVFSNNGKHFLCIHRNGSISVWETAGLQKKFEILPGTRPVLSAIFLPDSHRFLVGHADGSLAIHDVASGRMMRGLRNRSLRVSTLALAPSTDLFATGTEKGTVHIWSLSRGECLKTAAPHHGRIHDLIFSRDGRQLFSTGADGQIQVMNTETGTTVHTYQEHAAAVRALAIDTRRQRLYSGGNDATVNRWDLKTNRLIDSHRPHKRRITSLAMSPDNTHLASGSNDGKIQVCRLDENNATHTFDFGHGWILDVAFAPDMSTVAGGGFEEIRLWDMETGRLLHILEGHRGYVNAIAYSADGKYLVSGGEDGTVRCWDAAQGKEIRVIRGHTDTVTDVALSEDSRHLYSCSLDTSTRVWALESGQELMKLISSSDGEWLATTPEGFYHTSPEGTDLIRWGFRDGLETYSFEQFASVFNRKEVVLSRLAVPSENAMEQPRLTAPPIVHMEDHLTVKTVDSDMYRLKVRACGNEPVKVVRVFVNGRDVSEVPINASDKSVTIDVPLTGGANRLTAIAYDRRGFSSNPRYMDILSRNTAVLPDLHILSIGISRYPNLPPHWQLEFAHSDAQALADVLAQQAGHLFSRVHSTLLTNDTATSDHILESLERLQRVPAEDIVVVFMAGHGVMDTEGTFHFLSSHGQLVDPGKNSINWEKLSRHLQNIKGRTILLLDACHSGSIVNEIIVPNNTLAEELYAGKRGGVMVFSASKGRQYSMETPDLGDGFGLFTYALVQALGPQSGQADINKNHYVEFSELVDYVRYFVDRETGGSQTPWLSRKELFGDLPIAHVQ